MAAAKKATKRTGPAKAASAATAGHEEIRIKYDPVMIELSKAAAAHCLLVKNQDGLFDDDETAEWVESFATDALSEALKDAKVAYVKAVAAASAAKPKRADATPAAGAAR